MFTHSGIEMEFSTTLMPGKKLPSDLEIFLTLHSIGDISVPPKTAACIFGS